MRWLVWVVVASAIGAGCGGRQHPRVERGEQTVAAIHLEGNDAVDRDDLVEGLALEHLRRTGQVFEPYLVGRDEERVRGYYLRRGFFRVRVRSRVETAGDRVEVWFTVVEGPRARLSRIEVAGLPDDARVSADELRELIPLAPGEPFVYEAYDLAKPKLVTALEDAGYAHARMEATVAADRVTDEAIIRLELDTGPRARFGAIAIEGIDGALRDAAVDRLRAREGATYSATALTRSQAALYDMQRFASVRVEPERSGSRDAIVPITIRVVEAPRRELRLGGGFGVNPAFYEVRGRAGYTLTGWPTELDTTRLELRPAYVMLRDRDGFEPRIEATAALERLDFLRPFVRASVEVAFSYLAVEAYTSVGPRLRLGLRAPLHEDHVGAAAGWQLSVLRFPRIDEALDEPTRVDLGLAGGDNYYLGFYEQSVFLDLRDDPVAPRRGVYAELRAEEGAEAAGGELDFVRLTPELRGYLPLGPVVLAARGRVGTMLGDVPVTMRYFGGGASSQRGFPERTLAPTVERLVDGELRSAVVGGGGLVEVGAELRAPLATIRDLDLGGVLFLDGGDVGARLEDVQLDRLHWAAGVGLRLATVVGPVRLDVGYRLNRVGAGELRPDERFAYHLSLGEAF